MAPSVTSPIIKSTEDATVDCIIDEGTRQRNAEIVNGIFIPEEAELIKRISLACMPSNDILF